jgi:hypothetical protein
MSLAENLQDIYQRLMITADDIDMSVDEIYAYAKKFKLNRDSLYSFIKNRIAHSSTNKMEESAKKKPTFEDYMEILKAKRASTASGGGANYADSMVFYRGKALGRCPAGTTRSGRTCVPSTSTPSKAPGYKKQDLGGLSQAQVKALSKAKSTKDIIEAHKKHNKK